ncbi:short-chain dehydrogenase/reductase SDR (plasmid) [Methylobacterium aquaticum]|uniref:Short-chain dehydrogenase/reductase SDR n=2 Tax=Methylobacterium TaxID=407 RepID=A0A0C6FS37_9HYPH|nr:short-chain dehydrogenase/reductase SDR [Methylobacterium aquaticum]
MNAAGLETTSAALAPDCVLTGAGDVADPDFVEDLVAQASSRFGVVDGLVNTVSITRPAMIDKMTLLQWDQVIRPH